MENMKEAQECLTLAARMYADANVKYAQTMDRADMDNMVFWQNQLWTAAQSVAKFQGE